MRVVLLTAAVALLATACGTPSAPKRAKPSVPTLSTAKQATANIASASASLVSGKVLLTPIEGGGVHITGTLGGFTANSAHGFHVHETGDCSAADATSAGGHFNPFNMAHGNAASAAHHAGDMNNIVADSEGVVQLDVNLAEVTLGGGAINDIAGRALIVHGGQDDYSSQPAGNAGPRVGCGVIKITQ